jgi:hypothetical protein
MRRRSRRLAAAALGLGLGASAPATAHVVVERATLREWITGSALAVVARFESGPLVWEAPDGSDRQEHFRVRVLEVLEGEAPGDALEFFPHAEGFPRFREGDRALLFLERTAEEIEFATLAPRFAWFSAQGAGQEWKLEGDPPGERILALARRWRDLRRHGAPDPARAVRELLLAQLGSGVPRLRTDAVAALVRARALPGFLDAQGTAALAAFVDDPELPLTQRLALLRLLEGSPGFDAAPRLRALARSATSGPELAQMMRVAAASDDPVLHDWLATLGHDERAWVRREAARELSAAPATAEAPR